jgi:hypothetical protein
VPVAELLKLLEFNLVGENPRRLFGCLGVTQVIHQVNNPLPANGHAFEHNQTRTAQAQAGRTPRADGTCAGVRTPASYTVEQCLKDWL